MLPLTEGIMAGGAFLGGVGGMMSAFGSDSPAQIDPAVQVALEQQGIDVSRFMANLEAATRGYTLPFAQDLQQYPLQVQQAVQNAYTQSYGGIERGALNYGEGAFSGAPSPVATSAINNLAQTYAPMRATAQGQVASNLASANISPDSPLAQYLQSQGQLDLSRSFGQNAASIATNQANQDVQNALRIWETGQNAQHIAGTQMPEVPQTPADEQQARVADIQEQIRQTEEGLAALPNQLSRVYSPLNGQLQNLRQQLTEAQRPLLPTGVENASNVNIASYTEGGTGPNTYTQPGAATGAPGSSGGTTRSASTTTATPPGTGLYQGGVYSGNAAPSGYHGGTVGWTGGGSPRTNGLVLRPGQYSPDQYAAMTSAVNPYLARGQSITEDQLRTLGFSRGDQRGTRDLANRINQTAAANRRSRGGRADLDPDFFRTYGVNYYA